jgi:hypothetical protein
LAGVTQVRFFNGQLLATGTAQTAGHNVNASSDGLTWTPVLVSSNKGESVFWDGITYWVGADNGLFKSSDSQTWTQSPGLLDTGKVYGFVRGPAPVSGDGGGPPIIPSYVGTPGLIPVRDMGASPGPNFAGTLFATGDTAAKFQGGTWSTVTTPWDNQSSSMDCGVWAGPPINKYFIGGWADNLSAVPVLMSSSDGVTWTSLATPMDGSSANSYVETVIWNGSLLVAVGGGASSSAPSLITSTDGVTWTGRTTPFSWSGCYDVAWNGSKFMAVGVDISNNGAAATSTDGITWTAITTIPWNPSIGLYSVAWHPSSQLWIIVGPVTSQCLTSPDGVTWTVRTMPLNGGVFVRSGNGIAVIVGGTSMPNAPIATSPDGITWTARTIPSAPSVGGQYPYWDGATWWVGVYNGPGTNLLSSSDNGVTWDERTSPNSGTTTISGIFSQGTPQPPVAIPPPSSSISFVSYSATNATSVTSTVQFSAPSNLSAGNVLVAIIGGRIGQTMVPPTGWTTVGNSSDNTTWLFTKVVGSGEPSTYTFTGNQWQAGVILQYAGTLGLDGAPAFSFFNVGASPTAGAVTSTVTGDLWVTAFYTADGAVVTLPGGFTQRASSVSTGNDGIFAFDKPIASIGSTGTLTTGVTPDDVGTTVSLLLQPGTPPGPPTPPAFVSASTVDESSLTGASQVTVPAPSGLVAGNTLIAVVVAENTTIPTPGGWTYMANISGFYSFMHTVASSGEPSSYTFPFAATASGWAGTILQYSGVAGINGMTQNSWATVSSATVSSPVSQWDAEVCLAVYYGGGSAYGTPSGFTQRVQGTGTATRMAAYDVPVPTIGSMGGDPTTGAVTVTLTPATYGFGVCMLLHP